MPSIASTAVLLANGPTVIDAVPIAATPKFMLPIADRPLLEYQVSVLAAAGVKEIIICVSCECQVAFDHLMENMPDYRVRMRCITQTVPRGTGGCLKDVASYISGDDFWVFGADLFLDTDLKPMIDFHRKQNAVASVAAVCEGIPPWGYERVQCDDHGNVKTIHRYHPTQNRRSRFRPLGLYLFKRKILDRIPDQGFFDLKEQLFQLLYDTGAAAMAYEVTRYWRTISSLDNYMAANRDVLLRRTEFPFLQRRDTAFDPAAADPTGKMIAPLFFGKDVRVGTDAVLIGPSAVGHGCDIGSHVVVNGCLVFPGARIGAHAQLTNCIIGENAVIEDGAILRDSVLLDKIDTADEATGRLSPVLDNIPGETGINKKGRIIHRCGYLLWKRGFDIAFSLLALTLLSPLMLLIAIAIKLDSPGTVFFHQRRCGWYGVDFDMYKFRTMVQNAETVKRKIQHLNQVDGPMFKIVGDPRVTRVGRFLRATNLDEVPQFFNILIGEMALVGPRPLSWDEMRYNPRWRDQRITVPPGLIGLWQLTSHQNIAFSNWIHNDLKYIRESSVLLDLKILLFSVVQSAKGVFRLLESILTRQPRPKETDK
ncbi:hypothetical protein DSCO28_08800 [Desulfosarcina ovata subsp. sediminis]|uniref:Bacterial sugar transferase domain-containing protein n=1 Tax=Desulfosarcina ovata subsp. sediminis TaxID=885957 RepID=A0A5K7ZG60_9BACT|nr:sugar transferase [Desulfosarcina ovata]BBO80314.1 hypothetical protein DSCO28_08800 [Desulfosarcina ovata subsp. sediminis]